MGDNQTPQTNIPIPIDGLHRLPHRRPVSRLQRQGTMIRPNSSSLARGTILRSQSLKCPTTKSSFLGKHPAGLQEPKPEEQTPDQVNFREDGNKRATFAPKLSRAVTFKHNHERLHNPVVKFKPELVTNNEEEDSDDSLSLPHLSLGKSFRSRLVSSDVLKQDLLTEHIQYFIEKCRLKIRNFPTVLQQQSKGANFTSSLNWMKQFEKIQADFSDPKQCFSEVKKLYSRICKVSGYMEKIKMVFLYGLLDDCEQLDDSTVGSIANEFGLGKPNDRGWLIMHAGTIPYLGEIFLTELKREENYHAKYMSNTVTSLDEKKRRNQVVKWAIDTAKILKYPAETVHLTVYLIDAFVAITGNKMVSSGWQLLAVTALHIAGKLEETEPARLQRLLRLASSHYRADEVIWMEGNILTKLNMDVYPPLAPLFANMVLLGGGLELPTPHIVKLVMDLTQGILLKSLTNYRFSSVKSSVKAETALMIAIEFIFHQYTLFSRRDMTTYTIVNCEPGQQAGELAVNLCFEVFQQRLLPPTISNKVNATINSRPITASPVRNVKA